MMAEIAKMKKQGKKVEETTDVKKNVVGANKHLLKSGIDKKSNQGFKEKLIEEREERKRQRMERKKLALIQAKEAKQEQK